MAVLAPMRVQEKTMDFTTTAAAEPPVYQMKSRFQSGRHLSQFSNLLHKRIFLFFDNHAHNFVTNTHAIIRVNFVTHCITSNLKFKLETKSMPKTNIYCNTLTTKNIGTLAIVPNGCSQVYTTNPFRQRIRFFMAVRESRMSC